MTKEKHYDVAVVGGAGHVGLPLALSFADQGLNVLVNDINQAAMDSIAEGTVPFFEEGAEEMLARVLKASRVLQRNILDNDTGPRLASSGRGFDFLSL